MTEKTQKEMEKFFRFKNLHLPKNDDNSLKKTTWELIKKKSRQKSISGRRKTKKKWAYNQIVESIYLYTFVIFKRKMK